MIPKIIHYCWFGKGEKSELFFRCLESWRKYASDYQIIEWNEENFSINYNLYVNQAYNAKKYAFVADVCRLYALVNCGGVYMDTDVELIKPLDDLLINKAFGGCGYDGFPATGLLACEKDNQLFNQFLSDYDDKEFLINGQPNYKTNVERITPILEMHGFTPNGKFQSINGFSIYPVDFFNPKNHETLELNITKNTIAIHHFDGSWIDTENAYFNEKYRFNRHFFPKKLTGLITRFQTIKKFHGLKAAFHEFNKWRKK